MKRIAIYLGACALFSSACFAQTDSATLDTRALTALVKALEEKVESLEARIRALESDSVTVHVGNSEEEVLLTKSEWAEKVGAEVRKLSRKVEGAWTAPSKWSLIQEKMKLDDVLEILGKPSKRKFSVRKDTDEVFTYQGDLTGEGDEVRGEVRIYKGKVARFVVPDFPAGWE